MVSDRLDEATSYARRAIAMDRGLLGEEGFSLYVLCTIDTVLGRYDDALAACEKSAVIFGTWLSQAWLVAVYAQRGDVSKAALAKADLLKRQPAVTVEKFVTIEGSGVSEGYRRRLETHVAGGLRKAGLPER